MSVEDSINGLGHLINGKIVRSTSTFAVDNPSTGEVIAQCPDASLEQLEEAMAAAEAAGPAWAAAPEQTRRDAVLAMANILTERFAELNELAELEKGTKMAAGEAYRAPQLAGLTVSVSEPESFQVFAAGQSKGVLPAAEAPLGKLAE